VDQSEADSRILAEIRDAVNTLPQDQAVNVLNAFASARIAEFLIDSMAPIARPVFIAAMALKYPLPNG
jgi:hypothetical protein